MTTARLVSLAGLVFTWDGTEVAGLESIGEVPDEWESEAVFLHDTSGYYPEQILTTKKGGEIKISGILLPSDPGQIKMLADYAAGTSRAWTRTAPDGSWSQSGIGYVKQFAPAGKTPKDISKLAASILIDGAPTTSFEESAGLTTPFFSVTGTGGAGVITPAAANAKYEYNVSLVAGSTSYYITPTATAGTITVTDSSGNEQTVLTGANSTAITAPASDMHTVFIDVKETGKVAIRYILHVGEPV